MKTIKTTIALLAIAIFASSCSKNDDAPVVVTPPIAVQYRVKEIRTASNVVEYAYEYNAQNQEIKSIESGERTITKLYNTAGKIVQKKDSGYLSQTSSYPQITDYTYTNNLLDEEITRSPNNNKTKVVYTYVGTNIATKTNYSFVIATGTWAQSSGTTRYTYNSSNQLVQYQEDDFGVNLGKKSTFVYDDRGNEIEQKVNDKATAISAFKLKTIFSSVYDNIRPTNYPNSTLFEYGLIENSQKDYDATGTNLISTTTFIRKYERNPEGNKTKFFINNNLYFTYILEKIQ